MAIKFPLMKRLEEDQDIYWYGVMLFDTRFEMEDFLQALDAFPGAYLTGEYASSGRIRSFFVLPDQHAVQFKLTYDIKFDG